MREVIPGDDKAATLKVVKAGDRDGFAAVEPDEGRIDHFAHIHHLALRES